MEHSERMAIQREYVETSMADYKLNQKQEVLSQIPYMRLDDKELAEYIVAKKKEFDNQASDEEVAELLKNFNI
jgi:DTW domain-containing protein YfiP